MFLKIGMAILMVIIGCGIGAFLLALYLSGHGMETRDQWQQGDEE